MPDIKPRLTIAIPTFNRAHLVARAVESALAQTADRIEIIVSDNGSSDATPEVLSKYKDPRLRQIRHQHTLSQTAHANAILEMADGEFLLGLSDDDYIEPDFAARVLDLFDRRPELSFVWTGCFAHYGSIPVPALTGPEVESGLDFLANFFAGRREVCWCACVTRLGDLKAFGLLPEGVICGDMYYWTKLAFRGDVGCIAEPLSHYTLMGPGSVSGSAPVPAWAREMQTFADDVLAGFRRCGVGPERLQRLRRDCTEFVGRSTANQFVWNAMRGRSKSRLLADLQQSLRFLKGAPSVWARVVVALLLPGAALKNLVLRAAAQRAVSRANHYKQQQRQAPAAL